MSSAICFLLFLDKIELFRNQSCSDAFHDQNINHNVMNRLNRYIHLFSQHSKTYTMIFEHQFLDFVDVFIVDIEGRPERGKSTITSRFSLNSLYIHIPVFLTCTIHRRSSATFSELAHKISFDTQNLRQTLCSINFSIVKIVEHSKV